MSGAGIEWGSISLDRYNIAALTYVPITDDSEKLAMLPAVCPIVYEENSGCCQLRTSFDGRRNLNLHPYHQKFSIPDLDKVMFFE